MSYAGRMRTAALLAGVAAALAVLAGCGGKDFADKPRPATPVQLSGVITNSGVTVAPNKIGAGPVEILISNQTQLPHTLTLEGANIAPVRTEPIGPTDVGRIQQELGPGTYTVKAGSPQAMPRPIKPARLVIGKARPDSNDQVGLP
jgi:hypothetical protein